MEVYRCEDAGLLYEGLGRVYYEGYIEFHGVLLKVMMCYPCEIYGGLWL